MAKDEIDVDRFDVSFNRAKNAVILLLMLIVAFAIGLTVIKVGWIWLKVFIS